MTILHAFLLGIVEGVTEFLPISSTAHLLFTSKLLHISQTEFTTFFEVFIQSGAIFAVIVLYYKKFLHHKSLILNLLISFIPTAIVGFALHKVIKTVFFQSTSLIIFTFIIVGVLFILFEMYLKKKNIHLNKSISDMTLNSALIIGLFQAFAVLPGVSRAGAVIIGMMILRYNRRDAALYSFLLAVPTIFAASFYDLIKTDFSLVHQDNLILIVSIGLITSFITALVVIKWFIRFIERNSLAFFGVYRIILGLLLLLLP